jgi:hypothetical protein
MRRARAAMISGLSPATAADTTTASAPVMFSAAWPSAIAAPNCASRWVVALATASEPLIV